MEDDTIPAEPDSSSSNNGPGKIFASPRYIAAQLKSTPPSHLPPIVLTALPHVPQFGSHFGVDLIAEEVVRNCEATAMQQCNAVLHIPITRHWPRTEVSAPTKSPILWGYYVVEGETETIPIVKPGRRPRDEWALADVSIIMPIRYAKYSEGKLSPWKYKFVQRAHLCSEGTDLKEEFGQETAVQVLSTDIFSLLWYLNREVLYEAESLNCLYPREWVIPDEERHDENACPLFRFEEAIS